GRADDDADAGEARGAAVEVAVVPVVEQRGFHVVRRQAAETLGIRDEVVERGQLDLMGDHAESLLAADPATVVDVEVDSRAEPVVARLVYSAVFPPGDPGPVLPSVVDGSGLVADVDAAGRLLSCRLWASSWLPSTDGLLVDAWLDWLGVCEGGRDELVGRGAKLICAPGSRSGLWTIICVLRFSGEGEVNVAVGHFHGAAQLPVDDTGSFLGRQSGLVVVQDGHDPVHRRMAGDHLRAVAFQLVQAV